MTFRFMAKKPYLDTQGRKGSAAPGQISEKRPFLPDLLRLQGISPRVTTSGVAACCEHGFV
jgi:hypothetical protein